MKRNILLITIASVMIIAFMQSASADITFWRDVFIDYNKSIVTSQGVYNFNDNSKDFLGKYKAIPIGIMYNWENIPYNISTYFPQYSNALVDWCNFTIIHAKNDYTGDGFSANVTDEIFTFNVTSASAGNNLTAFFMKHQDSLSIRWDCHYTNPQTLFIEGVTFGDWGTFFPAFSCSGCEDFKLEELSKEVEFQQIQAEQEISIYQRFQTIVGLNMTLWSIFEWVVKIGLIFGAIGLIFLSGYFFYSLIMSLAGRTTK